MTHETFTDTLDYLEHIGDEIEFQVENNFGTCPCCIASEMFEENITQITNELYKVTKAGPEAGMAAIILSIDALYAKKVAFEELRETLEKLYPEKFKEQTTEETTKTK